MVVGEIWQSVLKIDAGKGFIIADTPEGCPYREEMKQKVLISLLQEEDFDPPETEEYKSAPIFRSGRFSCDASGFLLSFSFDLNDLLAIIVAALFAHAMVQLHLAATGALGDAGH